MWCARHRPACRRPQSHTRQWRLILLADLSVPPAESLTANILTERMSSSTRRVLVPMAWPSGKVGRGHLLPDVRGGSPRRFVRVPGGRSVSHGVVAFTGDSVTAEDMLERLESSEGPVADRETALHRLGQYVQWLSDLRLGSVFEAAYDEDGLLAARKVSDSPPVTRTPIPD